ncbi:unnamed protein product [Rotaria socialis]|nr:unnamed protein product [Rotaria socialis]
MNNAAKTTSRSTHDIVADGLSTLSDHAIASLPNLKNLKRTVQRIRQRHQNPLALPKDRTSLVIDPEFMKTNRNRTFLQFDSGSVDQRMLIFSTKKQLRMLENATHIYLDGTFSVVPELYFQLYTIHVEYLHHILPTVYVLLPGKKQCLYREMLRQIKNLLPNFDPPNVMIDFERARFLPAADVIPTFDEIKDQFPVEGEPVLKYFEENYIGVKSRLSRPRKSPKFDISLWNVNENTIQRKHRTNNAVEGWNNRFSSLMNCNHPNFWKFLKGLKKEQSFVEAQVIQAEAGVRQTRNREQIRREIRILNIINEPTTTNFQKVMALAQILSLKRS